jgi:chromosome segregation ATPase
MHLINWHNFVDDIIDFRNVTYLIGLNAVGKTTIIDAIRYCLTTNKEFNTAGNRKSARSLQGSVHQKQRAEESYLRPNHTVTYIGIEFFDDSINKNFVISVRVESESPKQELRHVSQDWYISKPGNGLDDMPYFTMVGNNKRPASREEFKLPDKGLDKAPSQAEARRRICRTLGIGDAEAPLGKKFNEVFHMGTSLEDINDIRKFIYTYILPEPEIDVEILHKDMRELERLQEILEEAQEKERLLRVIMDRLVQAKELDNKVKINEALVSYAKWQDAKEKQNKKLEEINEAKSTFEKCEILLDELELKREETQRLYDEARDERNNNKENKALDYLRDEEGRKNKEYKELIRNIQKYKEAIDKLEKLIVKLNKLGLITSIDYSDISNRENTVEYRRKAVEQCKNVLFDLQERIKDNDAEFRMRKHSLNDEIRLINEKIAKLETGKMYYPQGAEFVRDRINQRLKDLGKEESAKIFCELLYMNDVEWQNAVESYLSSQRFNIIVEPKHYEIAKSVFIELKDEVRNIGLIDTVRLSQIHMKNRDNIMPSLAEKVESKNPYAKLYAEFLLGNVICCETGTELERYHISVTKDRLRYQNFCLQRMRSVENYIGMDALLRQLENAKLELTNKYEEQGICEKKILEYAELDKQYHQFTTGNSINDLYDNLEAEEESEVLFDEICKIREQIMDFEKNPILRAIFSKIDNCKRNLDKVIDKISDVKSTKNSVQDIISNADIAINALQINIDEAQGEYEKIASTHTRYIEAVKEKYSEVRKSKQPDRIAADFGNQIQQGISNLNKYMNLELLPLQRDFSSRYACDYLEGLEGAEQYQLAFNSLVNIDLEHHRDSLNQAKIRCKERFRKEILFRMKDDILRAKQQFKVLNKVMEKLSYGEESYHFSIDGSKDKELSIFYNIIIDKDNQQIEKENQLSLFSSTTQSDVFESQVDEFMQRIMVDVENHAQENITGKKNGSKEISIYVDYRTYLDYDIIVKNCVTKLEVPLSKVSGDGSGGENQAPFYVAICASFLQIYQQNENCIRLVLLDEAFNKMTSDRIEPMMKMFRELNLQVVLISTVEKCTSIFPYCDITYSIVKSGSRNAIASFEGI